MNGVTAPGAIELACPDPVKAKLTVDAVAIADVLSHAEIVDVRPAPVIVTDVIVVAEPGLLSESVRLAVEATLASAVTPP